MMSLRRIHGLCGAFVLLSALPFLLRIRQRYNGSDKGAGGRSWAIVFSRMHADLRNHLTIVHDKCDPLDGRYSS